MKPLNCSLLISTYNWPNALDLVLKSVLGQTRIPSEIVIADDGSGNETFAVIQGYQNTLNIKHIWHEDLGFRKTIIMNKAVNAITNEYVVQVDGDMLLHPNFIEDHLNFAKKNHFIKGSRSMLSQSFTEKILSSKLLDFSFFRNNARSKINATRSPLLAKIFFGDKSRTDNLRGCNFAFWKKDFIAVNGYNNDLLGWGHEDVELAARLVNNGVFRRQLKMVAICHHLYHNINSRVNEVDNLQVYKDTVSHRIKTIPNGFHRSK